jgi:putative addiction module antidote
MVRQITLRRAGGSVSATLPKDMLDRLHVQAGDRVFAVETDKGVLLTPFDPTFELAMQAYEQVARKYRNALRELADK